ncbi:MAG: A/G-specific adenine glycosylase [Actinobacteria bacterium]|nr:A/G-specific adenine glycosylase [Actinomycetota bacterium]
MDLAATLLPWYAHHARKLPWREADAGPWAVLVSEFMLQQTPVARVLPVYAEWLTRWPTPTTLAGDTPGAAVRMWGKLGYPRRALRLHAAATVIRDRFGGSVPSEVDQLLGLPGVGEYTARAVAAFAFGQRVPVVDINVRRVVARAVHGQAQAAPPSARRDMAEVQAILPAAAADAARFSVAIMEFGALTCTARRPACSDCPLHSQCAWLRAGSPTYTGPVARPQRFTGTDRQVRGLLLDVLRETDGPVSAAALDVAWSEPGQRARALDSLVADGLIDPLSDGRYALPGHVTAN